MNDYEGVFIIDSQLGEEGVEKAIGEVEEIIGKSKGKIEKRENWGKKTLAYEVKAKNEGFYFLVNFQVEAKAIRELDKAYRLNDAILKYLIFRKED